MKCFRFLLLAVSLISASCAQEQKVNTIVNSMDNPIVIPPNCPDWSDGNSVNYNNNHSSNYGCATVTNFGAMIDDPNDMITGKSSDLTSSARSVSAITQYQSGSGGSASSSSSSSGQ